MAEIVGHISIKKIKNKFCVAYVSLSSRCVRRIRRTRSLNLGLNTSPAENMTDTFSTDWMSLSNWANNLVSVYFMNSDDLLIWKKKESNYWEKAVRHRQRELIVEYLYDKWRKDLLVNSCHCFCTIRMKFNGHVSPMIIHVPYHHIHSVACT